MGKAVERLWNWVCSLTLSEERLTAFCIQSRVLQADYVRAYRQIFPPVGGDQPMVRKQAVTPRTIVVTCPNCKTRLKLFRASVPQIDSCGFESYSFRCEWCASSLGGSLIP